MATGFQSVLTGTFCTLPDRVGEGIQRQEVGESLGQVGVIRIEDWQHWLWVVGRKPGGMKRCGDPPPWELQRREMAVIMFMGKSPGSMSTHS